MTDFLGKSEEGIKYAEKAIKIDSKKGVAYHNIGVGLTSLNRYEEAIQYYQKAVDLNYNSYINLGICYQTLEKYEKAIEAYTDALKINPNEYGIKLLIEQLLKLKDDSVG